MCQEFSCKAQVDQAGKGCTPIWPLLFAITDKVIPWRQRDWNFLQKDKLTSSQPENTEERSTWKHYIPRHKAVQKNCFADGRFPYQVRLRLSAFSAWQYLNLIPRLLKIVSTILKFYFLQVSNPITVKVFSSSMLSFSQPTWYLLSLLTLSLPRTVHTDLNTLAVGS